MDLFTTLIQARDHYKDKIKKAIASSSKKFIKCPCCDQKVKVYKRKLNSGMAITLIRMYQHSKLNYCHVVDAQSKQCTDYPQLRYWGLIEEEVSPVDGKKTSGVWRVTTPGLHFLKGLLTVKKYIHTINNNFIDFSGDDVSLKDCLPEKFDYQELMLKEGW